MSVTIGLTLSRAPLATPFDKREVIFAKREAEAGTFYEELLPEADPQDMKILRQSLAGMIWSKQFFHFDVARWLDGDQFPPPRGTQRRTQSPLAPHEGGRRDLHAGQVGVPVVRAMGPRVPLRSARAGRRRFRQGPDRAAAQRALHSSERPGAGLRVVVRRCESAGAGDGGAQSVSRRARAARQARHRLPAARDAQAADELHAGGSTARTPTATTCSRAASSVWTTSRCTTARSRCRPATASSRPTRPAGWRCSRST